MNTNNETDLEKMRKWISRGEEYKSLDKWYFGIDKEKRVMLETAVKKQILQDRLKTKLILIEEKDGM